MPIELKEVSFCYAPGSAHETVALRKVSVTVREGEYLGIMGKTGSGKSTLLQLLCGLLKPDSGSVLLDGEDINAPGYDRSKLRAAVGVVFQFPESQLFETTVERDVAFGLRHMGLGEGERQSRVRAALETVGFDYEAVRKKSPLGFSGGEKRRIAIAGVLAVQPKILILDEPIAGLDPLGRESFLRMLSRLNREGTTIIMISHNADVLAEQASRLLILENGGLLCDGPVDSVLEREGFLLHHGIPTGQIADIADALRWKGIPIPEGTVRYSQLLGALKSEFGRCGK